MYLDLSIIIPTRNRAGLLEETLNSILAQVANNVEYEVIVVDNGSTDHTNEVCSVFQNRFKNFIYDYDQVPGQLTGRHKGLFLSRSSLLSYLDDDVVLDPGWIEEAVNLSLQYPDIPIFGGPSVGRFENHPPLWINKYKESTPYGGSMCLPLSLLNLETPQLLIDPLFVFGLNMTIRKETLIELKGFHPDCIPSNLQKYQGDGETGLAIKAGLKNYRALYSARLGLRHWVPSSRLTPSYFNKWSYYNGICKSFTDLRTANNLYCHSDFIAQRSKSSLENLLFTRIKRTGLRIVEFFLNRSALQISFALTKAFKDGYAFHQNAFYSDPTVRAWVLRSDFLDYHLPDDN